MAVAHNAVSLTNVNKTRLVDDFYENWPKYNSYFKYNTIEKVKWFGDLDCLKGFVQNLFRSDGKWCSTGGSAKSFRLHQTSITWYTDTNSLTFHGEDGNILKDLIVKSCKSGCEALGHRDRVSIPFVNNNSYCASGINPQECHNCSRLSAEITELNLRVDGLYQIVNNLYLPILYGPFSNLYNINDK